MLEPIISVLKEQPLLLLFLIAAIGYPLGRLSWGGFSLGISAVLFVGLGFGALSPELKTPPLLYEFGLILFVYTIGISSGPAFFATLRRGGVQANVTIAAVITAAAALVFGAAKLLGLSSGYAAGLLSGSMTNTPALAAILERLKSENVSEALAAQPVVAYSVAYPMGVIGMLLAISIFRKVWKVPDPTPPEPLNHHSVLIEHPEKLKDLPEGLRIGRLQRDQDLHLLHPDEQICAGDTISLIGPESLLSQFIPQLGQDLGEALELSREKLDMRRMFVSQQDVAARPLRELKLLERYGATVTRIRRGDRDELADEHSVLQLGDRVRVVAPREKMAALTKLFGDSYHRLSEVDAMTFSVGIAAGLLLGLIPIPLFGGESFKLGLAGGPLIVGLILGALGRTGSLNWQLSYNAGLTLRQIGLILFLAGVGSRSGYAFFSTVQSPMGLKLFVVGALITCFAGSVVLWITHRWQGLPFDQCAGFLSGMQTQPAVLSFASESLRSEEPNTSYATVYPIATLMKLVLAQLLLLS